MLMTHHSTLPLDQNLDAKYQRVDRFAALLDVAGTAHDYVAVGHVHQRDVGSMNFRCTDSHTPIRGFSSHVRSPLDRLWSELARGS
ncbi:hypothetical protein C8J43_102622 [Sphingomonas sp. PP-CE-1G-424]|nr:hypothetical protein C8J43_102622 [Sphingomonas sp. PP-CE-1G-424]